MGFQDDPNHVRWRIHLRSPPEAVYRTLATDEGRARFWAESAVERGGIIAFVFPNGMRWQGTILEAEPPHRFAVDYFGNSAARFDLQADGDGGTDLVLTARPASPDDRTEDLAGWVSVLLSLKAAVDFGADLRNHDAARTWDQGYVDN